MDRFNRSMGTSRRPMMMDDVVAWPAHKNARHTPCLNRSTNPPNSPHYRRELRGKVEFIQQRHDKFGRALKTPGATAADPAVKDLYTCEFGLVL